MCFAYFKMNKFDRNPEKYIKEKCAFLFARGYSLKTTQRNAEYFFNFYIKDKDNRDINHIYFLYENDYVDCIFSNINTSKTNLKTLNIDYPILFDSLSNVEKIDFLIDSVQKNIELIDVRPMTELQQALNLSREGKHIEAYLIFEKLYNQTGNATNTFNLFQSAVYCGKTEVENKQLSVKLNPYEAIWLRM